MIKKAIVVFTVSFILYNIFLALADKTWSSSQSQNQTNLIVCERFLLSGKQHANVILGSSLGQRLLNDSLEDTYNLSLAGLGVQDGIEVLQKSPKLPVNLFVESNFAHRELDPSFASHFSSPFFVSVRTLIPALRQENQPVGILRHFVYSFMHRGERSSLATGEGSDRTLSNMLALAKSRKSLPDSADMSASIRKLKERLLQFRQKGCNIIFINMPVHPEIAALKEYQVRKQIFEEAFPRSEFRYIEDTITQYKTTDGLHLRRYESVQFTRYLKGSMSQLLGSAN